MSDIPFLYYTFEDEEQFVDDYWHGPFYSLDDIIKDALQDAQCRYCEDFVWYASLQKRPFKSNCEKLPLYSPACTMKYYYIVGNDDWDIYDDEWEGPFDTKEDAIETAYKDILENEYYDQQFIFIAQDEKSVRPSLKRFFQNQLAYERLIFGWDDFQERIQEADSDEECCISDDMTDSLEEDFKNIPKDKQEELTTKLVAVCLKFCEENDIFKHSYIGEHEKVINKYYNRKE